MYMNTVIVGWLLFKNIFTSGMSSMEKGTAARTYVKMKDPIIYKEDDCWGHKEDYENDPKVIKQFLG
jgi:hypothetical protein